MSNSQLASALGWIVNQVLDNSFDNIQEYSMQDAHREVADLTVVVEHVASLAGQTAEVERMQNKLSDINIVFSEMKAARDEKLKANGINIALEQGFEMRVIGSVSQLFKAIPGVDGHYIIDIGGGIDPTVNADMKDWGVTAIINSNGLRNYAVVVEKLTLEEALSAYQELELPVGPGLVQKEYQTWEDAGVSLGGGGPKL